MDPSTLGFDNEEFQSPVVTLETGEVAGFEALVRREHPQKKGLPGRVHPRGGGDRPRRAPRVLGP